MPHTITRILVPVDFSPHSDRALRYAETLADRFGAALHLVHVVEVPAMWGAEIYPTDLDVLVSDLAKNAEEHLASCRASVSASAPITTDVQVGRAATTIVQCASKTGADLIAMGTHGRGGLSHLFMGSVAERVVRTAPCPVLTVREPEDAFGSTDDQA